MSTEEAPETGLQALDRLQADLDAHEALHTQEALERAARDAADAAKGEYRPEYNGWRNRETWDTVLCMQKDEGLDAKARTVLVTAIDGADWDSRGSRDRDMEREYLLYVAGEALKRWWDDLFAPSEDLILAGPLQDAWSYAMACVNWHDVAAAIAEGYNIEHLPK